MSHIFLMIKLLLWNYCEKSEPKNFLKSNPNPCVINKEQKPLQINRFTTALLPSLSLNFAFKELGQCLTAYQKRGSNKGDESIGF